MDTPAPTSWRCFAMNGTKAVIVAPDYKEAARLFLEQTGEEAREIVPVQAG